MRALIYDAAILTLTGKWYAEVLERLAPGTHLLDVGIGTGGALAANASTLVAKDIRVTGVDIDADYVARARRVLARKRLKDRVDVRLESIYDHRGGPYDAVYFSASFMLMPDPSRCLRHVATLLAPEGRVFFTQTFQDRPSKLVERAKPMLKAVTTIEFGQVTYEDDFLRTVEEGGFEIVELETMSRSLDRARSYRLAVGRPRDEAAEHLPARGA